MTISDISEAWTRRQNDVKSARIHWRSSIVIVGHGSEHKVPGVPRKNTRGEEIGEWRIAGDKMWFSLNGPAWIEGTDNFANRVMKQTSDGKTRKHYFGAGRSGDQPFGAVGILGKQKDSMLGNVQLAPLRLVYFPFLGEAGTAIELSRFQLMGQREIIDGRSCVVLKEREDPHGMRRIFWLDVERDFLPLQYQFLHNDAVVEHYSLSFASSETGSLVPTACRTIIYASQAGNTGGAGLVRQFMKTTISRVEINPALGANDFEVEFPPGTKVSDFLSDPPKSYVVADE